MKYKLLKDIVEPANARAYDWQPARRAEIFEVIGKPYLLVRIYHDDVCVRQFFSNAENWQRRLYGYFIKGA